MRVLIVDDERPARDRLRRLLAGRPGIAAVEEARDGAEALERVAAFDPDAVFLDIQMPEVNGIEVAASLPDPAPAIVFVTAFDQYALRAFDAGAVDYLLKPYDEARFLRALERLRERVAQRRLHPAAERTMPAAAPLERLLVPGRDGMRAVMVADILWLETADNYVVVHTAAASLLMRQALSSLLPSLGAPFLRCHRRAAVRVAAVERIVTDDKGDAELHLRGGAVVPCSRQHRAALVARLQAG